MISEKQIRDARDEWLMMLGKPGLMSYSDIYEAGLRAGVDLAEKPVPKFSDDIETIFDYWRKRMDSPRSKLDAKRKKVITAALKIGYTPAEICQAIRGCSLTPHNMGQNENGQKYNGIELILRNADQIDRFIANDKAPPALSKAQPRDMRAERNAARKAAFTGGVYDSQNVPSLHQIVLSIDEKDIW